jgi:hypothetical protein
MNLSQLEWRKRVNHVINVLGPYRDGNSNLSTIALWPRLDDSIRETKLFSRIKWYLGDGITDTEVYYRQSKKLESTFPKNENMPESIPFKHIETNRIKKELDNVDRILIYDISCIDNILVLPYVSKVRIIDPNFYSTTELDNWLELSYEYRSSTPNRSAQNFERLLERFENASTAYAIGPGPSSEKMASMDIDKRSITIICNSLVKDREITNNIEPDILVHADPVFFGPSEYTTELLSDSVDIVKKYNSFLFVPEKARLLMEDKHPSIKENLIGFELIPDNNIIFPTPNQLKLPSGYVLPKKVLPIASTIADSVYISGADGYSKNKKSYKNSSDVNKKEKSFKKWHPSYLRHKSNRSQRNTGNQKAFKEVIKFGRKKGVEYFSLCRSEYDVIDDIFVGQALL